MAAVARPLASVQPERKTPPRAGLKYWDERTQRVVELVPPAQCPTSREVPLVHKKFFVDLPRGRDGVKSSRKCVVSRHTLLGETLRPHSKLRSFPRRRESRANLGPRNGVPATAKARLRASVTRYASRGAPRGDERKEVDTSLDAADTDVAPVALVCYFVRRLRPAEAKLHFGPVSH
jgi:hypothetical protein